MQYMVSRDISTSHQSVDIQTLEASVKELCLKHCNNSTIVDYLTSAMDFSDLLGFDWGASLDYVSWP